MNNATHGFEDMADDLGILDGSNSSTEAAKITLYKRDCPKCHGSGRYLAPTSLGHNRCLKCGGRGYFETKVSPEQASARKDRRDARKEKQESGRKADIFNQAVAWRIANPNEAHWMKEASARGFNFATSMMAAVEQWGHLTDNQLTAVRKCLVSDEQRAAERAARNSEQEFRKQAVDITPVINAFAKAGSSLRKPILRTPDFRFSQASALGKNPGAIYVKTLGTENLEGLYLGKILNGTFTPGRECTPEMQAKVIETCQDPLEAVLRYARLTGRCGICDRTLTKKESTERGIGPICAEKFGF